MNKCLVIYFIIVFTLSKYYGYSQDNQVRIDSIYSPAVELRLKYTTILPKNYDSNPEKKFPIMILLHGHTGNYTSWISYAGFDTNLATTFQTIVVLPDGGNSWYVNWSGQTDGKPHRWEDMITKDLLPDVSKKYRVKNGRNATSIGGLSMGGYGALAIGLRNLKIFGSVFSIAGAIDFSKNIQREFERDTLDWNSPMLWSNGDKVTDVPNFSTQKERTPQGLVFKTIKEAEDYDPYKILEKTTVEETPYIITICGLNDYFIKDARTFREGLVNKEIAHTYIEMPGAHEVPFWENYIELVFPLLRNNRQKEIKQKNRKTE